MLDTVKINHVQHISFTQSRLTDAVSVILSELLSYEHPSKPVGVLKRLIEVFTDPGDVVIDPVAGSGTTLRAAYELGRSAYGFEVDKSFYEAAREKMLAPILAEKTTI